MGYLQIVLTVAFTVVFAVLFFKTAEFEKRSPAIWCSLSVLLSCLFAFVFPVGWLGFFGVQAGLFGALFGLNVLKERKRAE